MLLEWCLIQTLTLHNGATGLHNVGECTRRIHCRNGTVQNVCLCCVQTQNGRIEVENSPQLRLGESTSPSSGWVFLWFSWCSNWYLELKGIVFLITNIVVVFSYLVSLV